MGSEIPQPIDPPPPERRWPTAEEMERERHMRRMVDYAHATQPVIDILYKLEMLHGLALTRDANGDERLVQTYPPEVESVRQQAFECLRMIARHYGIDAPLSDSADYSYASAVEDLKAYRKKFGR